MQKMTSRCIEHMLKDIQAEKSAKTDGGMCA